MKTVPSTLSQSFASPRPSCHRRGILGLALAIGVVIPPAAAHAQLTYLPPSDWWASQMIASNLSRDGSTLAIGGIHDYGSSGGDGGGWGPLGTAQVWRPGEGYTSSGLISGVNWIQGISGDGAVVVGQAWGRFWSAPVGGYVWNDRTGQTSWPSWDSFSRVLAVSNDASAVLLDENQHLSLVTSGGSELITTGYVFQAAISDDLSTVIAEATLTGQCWVRGRGVTSLPMLPGTVWQEPKILRPDGKVAFGVAWLPEGAALVRWTLNGDGAHQVQAIYGPVSAYEMSVTGTSNDGSRVVMNIDDQAFIWTAAHGALPLATHLAACGIPVTGPALSHVSGISGDGKIFAGYSELREDDEYDTPFGYISWYARTPSAPAVVANPATTRERLPR